VNRIGPQPAPGNDINVALMSLSQHRYGIDVASRAAQGRGWDLGVAPGWRLGDDGGMGVLEVTDEVGFVAGSVAP
jgi:hypothetical protein